ncbi:sensor histidine kinase [Brevundimonas subvibrioides]|uniref:histidine kinase n=1 Tax=Brevundimonas subvibrioides (strain ATCC 15264 / DSM 4735 / LMG 14903 / NBRC 16000 / CB 81) TaxID=633149 RepID=D9QN87_BRESC|nr:PAS domain-containing protein [Brevundimonas subvibrioides]ADL00288.1 signal transduction histidine kinase [Brevundimonas subvibrioides ATCC 15264]
MTAADLPANETERLAALRAYDILDSEREQGFDDIVKLASAVCDAPIAVVNLIDRGRQWFKAEVGLGVRETPLETSLCAHALLQEDGMVVPDATLDPRFECNPLVSPEGGLRFYAGRLLKSRDGYVLGTLCVLDTKARPQGLTPRQEETLEILARQVMSLLELRRTVRERDKGIADLAESESKFRAIADSMPQMVWSTRPDGFHDYYNARWYEFTGVPPGSTDGEAWNGMFHAEDQERAWEAWEHSLRTGDLYEIEYRLRRADGVYRWTLGRATPIRNAEGQIVRWFGTCTDIDDLKKMEQGKDLVSQELSHRIKNIFAVISALIALSAREYPEAKAFAAAVRNRIGALARAHEFVRPHSEVSRPTVGDTTLHTFLNALFKPYADNSGQPRVLIEGEDAVFDDQAATSVALLFHELATNAAKYGALSTQDGRILLHTRAQDDRFILCWKEVGGPPVVSQPTRVGFGSSLATLSVEGQLGGRLERSWRPEGLVVEADLPATALSRRRAALKLA